MEWIQMWVITSLLLVVVEVTCRDVTSGQPVKTARLGRKQSGIGSHVGLCEALQYPCLIGTVLPHPDNCQHYLQCVFPGVGEVGVSNNWIVRSCSQGTLFDRRQLFCVLPVEGLECAEKCDMNGTQKAEPLEKEESSPTEGKLRTKATSLPQASSSEGEPTFSQKHASSDGRSLVTVATNYHHEPAKSQFNPDVHPEKPANSYVPPPALSLKPTRRGASSSETSQRRVASHHIFLPTGYSLPSEVHYPRGVRPIAEDVPAKGVAHYIRPGTVSSDGYRAAMLKARDQAIQAARNQRRDRGPSGEQSVKQRVWPPGDQNVQQGVEAKQGSGSGYQGNTEQFWQNRRRLEYGKNPSENHRHVANLQGRDSHERRAKSRDERMKEGRVREGIRRSGGVVPRRTNGRPKLRNEGDGEGTSTSNRNSPDVRIASRIERRNEQHVHRGSMRRGDVPKNRPKDTIALRTKGNDQGIQTTGRVSLGGKRGQRTESQDVHGRPEREKTDSVQGINTRHVEFRTYSGKAKTKHDTGKQTNTVALYAQEYRRNSQSNARNLGSRHRIAKIDQAMPQKRIDTRSNTPYRNNTPFSRTRKLSPIVPMHSRIESKRLNIKETMPSPAPILAPSTLPTRQTQFKSSLVTGEARPGLAQHKWSGSSGVAGNSVTPGAKYTLQKTPTTKSSFEEFGAATTISTTEAPRTALPWGMFYKLLRKYAKGTSDGMHTDRDLVPQTDHRDLAKPRGKQESVHPIHNAENTAAKGKRSSDSLVLNEGLDISKHGTSEGKKSDNSHARPFRKGSSRQHHAKLLATTSMSYLSRPGQKQHKSGTKQQTRPGSSKGIPGSQLLRTSPNVRHSSRQLPIPKTVADSTSKQLKPQGRQGNIPVQTMHDEMSPTSAHTHRDHIEPPLEPTSSTPFSKHDASKPTGKKVNNHNRDSSKAIPKKLGSMKYALESDSPTPALTEQISASQTRRKLTIQPSSKFSSEEISGGSSSSEELLRNIELIFPELNVSDLDQGVLAALLKIQWSSETTDLTHAPSSMAMDPKNDQGLTKPTAQPTTPKSNLERKSKTKQVKIVRIPLNGLAETLMRQKNTDTSAGRAVGRIRDLYQTLRRRLRLQGYRPILKIAGVQATPSPTMVQPAPPPTKVWPSPAPIQVQAAQLTKVQQVLPPVQVQPALPSAKVQPGAQPVKVQPAVHPSEVPNKASQNSGPEESSPDTTTTKGGTYEMQLQIDHGSSMGSKGDAAHTPTSRTLSSSNLPTNGATIPYNGEHGVNVFQRLTTESLRTMRHSHSLSRDQKVQGHKDTNIKHNSDSNGSVKGHVEGESGIITTPSILTGSGEIETINLAGAGTPETDSAREYERESNIDYPSSREVGLIDGGESVRDVFHLVTQNPKIPSATQLVNIEYGSVNMPAKRDGDSTSFEMVYSVSKEEVGKGVNSQTEVAKGTHGHTEDLPHPTDEHDMTGHHSSKSDHEVQPLTIPGAMPPASGWRSVEHKMLTIPLDQTEAESDLFEHIHPINVSTEAPRYATNTTLTNGAPVTTQGASPGVISTGATISTSRGIQLSTSGGPHSSSTTPRANSVTAIHVMASTARSPESMLMGISTKDKFASSRTVTVGWHSKHQPRTVSVGVMSQPTPTVHSLSNSSYNQASTEASTDDNSKVWKSTLHDSTKVITTHSSPMWSRLQPSHKAPIDVTPDGAAERDHSLDTQIVTVGVNVNNTLNVLNIVTSHFLNSTNNGRGDEVTTSRPDTVTTMSVAIKSKGLSVGLIVGVSLVVILLVAIGVLPLVFCSIYKKGRKRLKENYADHTDVTTLASYGTTHRNFPSTATLASSVGSSRPLLRTPSWINKILLFKKLNRKSSPTDHCLVNMYHDRCQSTEDLYNYHGNRGCHMAAAVAYATLSLERQSRLQNGRPRESSMSRLDDVMSDFTDDNVFYIKRPRVKAKHYMPSVV